MRADSRLTALHDLVREFDGEMFLGAKFPSRNPNYEAWELTVVLPREVKNGQ